MDVHHRAPSEAGERWPQTAALRSWIVALTALALALSGVTVAAEPVEFDVPAQAMGPALRAFAEQADLQIFYAEELVENIDSPGVRGRLEVEAALEALLRGSGLAFRWAEDETIAIVSAEDPGDETDAASGAADAASAPTGENASQDTGGEDPEDMRRFSDEITVMGTNIRGTEAPPESPVITVDRQEFEQLGMATAKEYIERLPQNFGQPRQNYLDGRNQTFGAGVDLRGLGADSTLVLLNGRRIAGSGGGNGQFTDISFIPVAALEQVDLLVDGASAIYGADAVGGVVNFVLRDRFEGFEFSLRGGSYEDGNEGLFSGVWGTGWAGGDIVVAYEYETQDDLLRADRSFSATQDLTGMGGSDWRVPFNNPGNVLGPGGSIPGLGVPVAAIPTGQDGTSLTLDDFSETAGITVPGDLGGGISLIPATERHSFFLNLDQNLGDSLSLFATAMYSDRHTESNFWFPFTTMLVQPSHPYSPFEGPVFVQYAFREVGLQEIETDSSLLAVTAGLGGALGGGWSWEVVGTASEDEGRSENRNLVNRGALNAALADPDPDTVFNPWGDGSANNPDTIDQIRGVVLRSGTGKMFSGTAKASGPLMTLSGGQVLAAVGLEYRDESYDSELYAEYNIPATEEQLSNQRDVRAAFGEVRVPLVSNANARPGIQRLNLSLAARWEDYSDFGASTSPKIGLAWSPTRSFTVRSTWGESFRAPLLYELYLSVVSNFWPVFDPARNEMVVAEFLQGGNPDLQPENAETFTAGVDFQPEGLPGLRLGLNYYDIRFDDQITTEVFTVMLAQEEFFPDQIIRADPTPEDIAAGLPGQLLVVDGRRFNASTTQTQGLDFVGRYVTETGIGIFDCALNLNKILEFERETIAGLGYRELLDTVGNPVSFKGRGSLGLTGKRLGGAVQVVYIDSYINDRGRTGTDQVVESYTTVDATLSYTLPPLGILNGLEIQAGAINVFDEDPPFVDIDGGYDPRLIDPRGRLFFLRLKFAL